MDEPTQNDALSVALEPNKILTSFLVVDIEAVMSYIGNLKQNIPHLDPINVSKLPKVYEHTAEFITHIVNQCF